MNQDFDHDLHGNVLIWQNVTIPERYVGGVVGPWLVWDARQEAENCAMQQMMNQEARRIMDKMAGNQTRDDNIGGVELLQMARDEIVQLRKRNAELEGKAVAYEALLTTLSFARRGGEGYPSMRDVVPIIEQKLRDIERSMRSPDEEKTDTVKIRTPFTSGASLVQSPPNPNGQI